MTKLDINATSNSRPKIRIASAISVFSPFLWHLFSIIKNVPIEMGTGANATAVIRMSLAILLNLIKSIIIPLTCRW